MEKKASKSSSWSFEQNKRFEGALATAVLPNNTNKKDNEDGWEKLAKAVGDGKTAEDVKRHYEKLEEDIMLIESGAVPLNKYRSSSSDYNNNSKSDSGKKMLLPTQRMRYRKLR